MACVKHVDGTKSHVARWYARNRYTKYQELIRVNCILWFTFDLSGLPFAMLLAQMLTHGIISTLQIFDCFLNSSENG